MPTLDQSQENDQVMDIITTNDMENISMCIFCYLLYNKQRILHSGAKI